LLDRVLGIFAGWKGKIVGRLEVEAELDDFEVPVAEVAPEELVDGAGGFVEAVVGECAMDLGGDGVEAGENPAGFEGVGGSRSHPSR